MRLNVYALCLPLLVGALLVSSGCQGGAGGGAGGKRIGVTLLTREHVFYKDLEAGLKEAADKQGYQLTVTSGDFDLARQQSQIENFIVQRVDAIIVCPADSKGIGPAIEQANRAGIPVFTADIAAQGGQVVSHVASDNLAGGRLAAEFIARAINEQGEVGIIGQQEVQSGLDRELGFKEEMKKYPGIKVAAVLNGGGVRDKALKAAEDMLQGNPNLKGLFGINDDSALGALSAAEASGRKELVIVGYDAIPEAVSAIKRGSALKADVAQQPRDLGAKTIEAISKHFAGSPVEKSISVPVKIVDANSLK
ncbi:MAG: ribose transport system substrate-binding protein [Acidobacteriota bacterium]|jgi:ribose transport system substrate-binding protein|nr:ribose transport system substrate-binding protein [Acidobacteriota bacterium]